MLPANTEILIDAEAVAVKAYLTIAQLGQLAIEERGKFRLVLAGGTTPTRAYELLSQTHQDWDQWEIFWGDERCLPSNHAERNSRCAHLAWLSKVPIPTNNIYPIPSEQGAEGAAELYAQHIATKLPFDLVILGMGEDGHTASLFPGHDIPESLTMAVHDAPKPPPDRVSLTTTALQHCRQQLILVTGRSKREALQQWQRGKGLPIAQVTLPDAILLLDHDSAHAE